MAIKQTRSINLTIFLMKCIGLWYFTNKFEKIVADTMLTLTFASVVFSIFIQTNELYHSKGNIRELTFIAPCSTAVFTEFIKLLVFITNRKRVMQLNKFTNDRFWKAEYSDEETKILNDCDRLCFKGITLYTITLQGICWHYCMAPIFELMGKNLSERTFPFPIYSDLPITKTPYYEILFISEIFGTLATDVCVTAFASFLFTMNMFTAAQFKILNSHLRSVCDYDKNEMKRDDLTLQLESRRKLKDCIREHQLLINYTNEVENLYCYAMLVQIFGSITQICMPGLQIILNTTSSNRSLQRLILSMEYLIGSSLQFYFYCYSSHQIFIESVKVSDSAYSAKWFTITKKSLRKDFRQLIQIIILRSRRPCILTVGKVGPLTLNTFAVVLNKSLSYLTVLRQTI